VILVLDTRIFDEYADVLRRKKFGFPEDAVQEILTFIRREGMLITPVPVTCTIPEDPRLTRASAWLAWFLASRTKGTLVDASSRPQDLETWRRSLE